MRSPPILMPKLGLTMTEGVLAEWKVAAGDTVAVGDVLFVVETDKISNEVEAQAAGIIGALLAAEGETLPVGAVLANWARMAAEAIETVPDAESTRHDAPISRTVLPTETGARVRATPLARRVAARKGISLADVFGSGPRGRVTTEDVEASVMRGLRQAQVERTVDHKQSWLDQAPTPAQPEPEPVEGRARTQARPTRTQVSPAPLTPYQRTAARRLTEAKRDIPHFYVQTDADVTELLNLSGQLNTDADHLKLTVSYFLVAALARALAGLPDVNRVWADDHLRGFATIDIGMAVETPKGLVAPVLRDLGPLSLDEVAAAADALVARARAGRLAPEDLTGGAITLSNVGMFGAKALVPIVNPGQSSILGVGAAQGVFRPDANGAPVLRQVLTLTLSCDHRVIDGALAARFLAALVRRLESPAGLLRRPPPQDPAS